MKNPLLMLLLVSATSGAALAQSCPNAQNLVGNCGFNTTIQGYTPQEPGDVISYDGTVGDTQIGAMRVADTAADAGGDAEAETCVNLTNSRAYALGASFRGINARQCFVGWDEYLGTNCTQPNGVFSASAPIDPSTVAFSRFATTKTVIDTIRSVELAIVCAPDANPEGAFFVDDVFVISDTIFANGFQLP
jgi:hypothetical protein